jgi:hypothetical protein
MKLPYTAPNPLSTDYRPELDVTPELGEADASYYVLPHIDWCFTMDS